VTARVNENVIECVHERVRVRKRETDREISERMQVQPTRRIAGLTEILNNLCLVLRALIKLHKQQQPQLAEDSQPHLRREAGLKLPDFLLSRVRSVRVIRSLQ
jgi:hypothetical protein